MIESLGLLDADSIVTVTDARMERILRRDGRLSVSHVRNA
jgi:hypothetical protein